MILVAVISLALGILCGAFLLPETWVSFLQQLSGPALDLLMLSVGVSVGANKLILRYLRENSLKILLIPGTIIVCSLIGGFLASLLVDIQPHVGVSIAAGLGWYSLSGVMLTDLCGAEMGSLTFLANVFREIFSFLTIPLLAKYLGPYVTIAPAAATSEDTSLPMIMKYGGKEVAVAAVLNGVICSLAVPFLIEFCYHLPF